VQTLFVYHIFWDLNRRSKEHRHLLYYLIFFFILLCIFLWRIIPESGLGRLIVEVTRSHTETPHLVGLFWTRDQSVAETSAWQLTTLTRDRHPFFRRDSNPQSQQASGLRPTP